MATTTALPLQDLHAAIQGEQPSVQKSYDVIVIGVGSMGAAACAHLASRGMRVLGLEQFDIPHDQGSHAGQTRIIRKAYFEHPDYVPLLERAYQNWKSLEAEANTQVYYKTELLYAGKKDNILMSGVRESASKYKVPVDELTPDRLRQRYPQFNVPAGYDVLIEPDAGFVTPERAILLYVQQALLAGAHIRTKETTLSWKRVGDSVSVTTNKGTYTASRLVITAGPWAGKFLPGLQKQLTVTRQVVAWVKPHNWSAHALGQLPCWTFAEEGKPGLYYGFPIVPVGQFGGPVGLKLGHHTPGLVSDPDHVNRETNASDEANLVELLHRFMPEAYESTHVVKTCLYTNTPDENFILGALPGYEQQVAIAAGFSGHGFKFASVVGEIMADLAASGKTAQPIGFLTPTRFIK